MELKTNEIRHSIRILNKLCFDHIKNNPLEIMLATFALIEAHMDVSITLANKGHDEEP